MDSVTKEGVWRDGSWGVTQAEAGQGRDVAHYRLSLEGDCWKD